MANNNLDILKKLPDNKDVVMVLEKDYRGWTVGAILDVEVWKARQLVEQGIARLAEGAKDAEAIAAKVMKEQHMINHLAGDTNS